MSLISCPECGTKISDKAITCPHCGYIGTDHSLPISVQASFEAVPTFSYDIEMIDLNKSQFGAVSIEDNRKLVEYFGNWENIQLILPDIAQAIRNMAQKEKVLIADIDPYIKNLIKKGIYNFSIDKQGKILPTIRDSNNIVKQVRLEEVTLIPTELTSTLNNLSTHAAMSQILADIEYIGNTIMELHIELQNDRIALAESAKDKLLQAAEIQDTKLREMSILNAISSATEAKRVLMISFSESLRYIEEHTDKNDMQLSLKKSKYISQKASDAFQSLISITNTVQAECEGYAMLGEYEASKKSLLQFKEFITSNQLDNKDTILLLNENTKQKQNTLVEQFMIISQRITSFNADQALTEPNIFMITEDSGNGE